MRIRLKEVEITSRTQICLFNFVPLSDITYNSALQGNASSFGQRLVAVNTLKPLGITDNKSRVSSRSSCKKTVILYQIHIIYAHIQT